MRSNTAGRTFVQLTTFLVQVKSTLLFTVSVEALLLRYSTNIFVANFLIDAVPLRFDGPVVVGANSSNVMYGQSLTLGCWIYGYPLPSIQVTTVANTIFISRNETPSNRNQIANNKTSLLMKFKIQKVTVHESGSYSCQQNLTNEQDLSQGSLTVNGKMCQHLLLQYKL